MYQISIVIKTPFFVLLHFKIKTMSETIKPYQDSEKGKKEQVAQMFDTISENYDGLNKIISLIKKYF